MASALSAAVPVSPPRTGGIERTAMLVEKLNPSHAAFIRKDYAAAKAHKAIASHVPARPRFPLGRRGQRGAGATAGAGGLSGAVRQRPDGDPPVAAHHGGAVRAVGIGTVRETAPGLAAESWRFHDAVPSEPSPKTPQSSPVWACHGLGRVG